MLEIFVVVAIALLVYNGFIYILNAWNEHKQNIKEIDIQEQDWSIPLYVHYNKDKTMFYAWDITDEFVGQSSDKESLLTMISERYKIPKDKFFIKDMTPL